MGLLAALLATWACFVVIPAPGNLPLLDVLGQLRLALPGMLAFGLVLGAMQAQTLPRQPSRSWWLPTTAASMLIALIGISLAQRLLMTMTGFSWCGVLIGGTDRPLAQVLWVGIGGLIGGAIGLPIGVLTGGVLLWLVRPQPNTNLGRAQRRSRWLPRLTTLGVFGCSLLFWYPVVRVQPAPVVRLHTVPCWYTGPANSYGLGKIYTQPTAHNSDDGYYQPPPMRCAEKITENAEGRWRWVEGTYQSGWVLETYLQISGTDQRKPTMPNQPSPYELRRITTNGGAVVHAGWIADDQRVFAVTADAGLRVWNIERIQESRRIDRADGELLGAALSPDARAFLIADMSETPQLIDAESGQELRRLKHPVLLAEQITSVGLSPDGQSALAAWTDGNIRVWNLASGTETLDLWGHERITSVAFTPDGRTIVSAQFGNGLQLWDVAQGKELRLLGPERYQVTSIAISPDGATVLAGATDGSVRRWDLASGKELSHFNMHAKSVTSLAFSPDGHSVLSGAADGTIVLWDLASGRARRSFVGHSNMVTSLAFYPDGKTALSGSWDGTLRVWRIE